MFFAARAIEPILPAYFGLYKTMLIFLVLTFKIIPFPAEEYYCFNYTYVEETDNPGLRRGRLCHQT